MIEVCETGVNVNTTGTSLVGTVRTTYADLVIAFGTPTSTLPDPNEKVNTEWVVEFYDTYWEEYITATIYNWKTGYTPVEGYEWHVGGFDERALASVIAKLDE